MSTTARSTHLSSTFTTTAVVGDGLLRSAGATLLFGGVWLPATFGRIFDDQDAIRRVRWSEGMASFFDVAEGGRTPFDPWFDRALTQPPRLRLERLAKGHSSDVDPDQVHAGSGDDVVSAHGACSERAR